MDVLILANHDWANTGYRFSRCLKEIGLDVLAFKGKPHPFLYPDQLPIHPILATLPDGYFAYDCHSLEPLASKAKVLHYIASTVIQPFPLETSGKHVVVQHGGATYRTRREAINPIYNRFVSASIIQMPDLLGFGAKNEQWIYYPVDTYVIQPDFKPKDNNKIVIGHLPSNSENKGTEAILKVIDSLMADPSIKDRIEYIGVKSTKGKCVSWLDALSHLKRCDVFIEAMQLTAQGRTYGEWGNMALEAAASGCIVITHFLSEEKYLREFGEHALMVANDPEALEIQIRRLLDMDSHEIMQRKQASRAWAEKHSIHNTAIRLWEKVYSQFFERTEVGGRQ
jgi:glycosyltransferase involved in cell wall biosynthesis